MEIKNIKLSSLKLDLQNLRGHSEEEIQLISRSLTIFGQYKPLIVDKNTMTVKIGNGRLMAMRKLGWSSADCVLLDWSNKKGMEIIDNRLSDENDPIQNDNIDFKAFEMNTPQYTCELIEKKLKEITDCE